MNEQTALDRAVEEIERGSRNPFRNQQGVKEKIDPYILNGFTDPDEVANEERICAHFHRGFRQAEDTVDGCSCEHGDAAPEPADFRDGVVDHVKCKCQGGQTCLLCVTKIDLLTIPERVLCGSRLLPDIGPVERFEVEMKISDAIGLGLISEEDLPKELREE